VAEQDAGDTIQFVRYLPMLSARAKKVILLCLPPTKPLFQSMPGIEVIASGERRPTFHAHLSVVSLPRIFGTTMETIPADVPYLTAEPERVARWRERVASDAAKLKVGVVFAGSPAHNSDKHRSMRFEQLAPPLMNVRSDVAWFSLQKGAAEEQVSAARAAGMRIVDLGTELI